MTPTPCPVITGTATVTCHGPRCHTTVAIPFDDLCADEIDDHATLSAQEDHHWHKGMYCPACRDWALADEDDEPLYTDH